MRTMSSGVDENWHLPEGTPEGGKLGSLRRTSLICVVFVFLWQHGGNPARFPETSQMGILTDLKWDWDQATMLLKPEDAGHRGPTEQPSALTLP